MDANNEKTGELSPLKRALIALRELRLKLDTLERAKTEPVAITGIGCRFPGGADTPERFWELLSRGESPISDLPAGRWPKEAFFDPDPEAPGKMYTTLGGYLQDVDRFDPQFWGLSPRETASMDPQHRLLLEVSWEALERAGQAPENLVGSKTGVYIGISGMDYSWMQFFHTGIGQVDTYMGTGNMLSTAAGRISYLLGLQGPALSVDTACSSSLVAIHLACQHLRAGKCDMALAGGVNLILSPLGSVYLSKSRALAPDGRCKTFDAEADGYVRGEGCGVIVLKRLSDALADGDPIWAVIRGTAINHDGRSSGLTVPNGQAQRAVIEAALADAGDLTADQIDYIEAHGTGTPLGDPIELRALAETLGRGRDKGRPIYLGSVKTNFGHTEAAAGVAGLIKAVLAIRNGMLPPHLHFQTPTPHFDWEQHAFDVPTRLIPWERKDGRRVAGTSSFGFSGTNAHIILESAPQPEAEAPKPEIERPAHLLALSAQTTEALAALAGRYREYVSAGPARDDPRALADAIYTANTGRTHFKHRAAVSASSPAEFDERLAALSAGQEAPGVTQGQAPAAGKLKIAFLFSGQGSQYAGMGAKLYETQPVFKEALDECDRLLRPHLEQPLLSVLFPTPAQPSPIDQTTYTQPALFALEYALARLWQSWGITPSAVLGHSVGELAAACLAGVFSLEDGLRLVAARGRLMGAQPEGGAMAAVFAGEAEVRSALAAFAGEVEVAAVNGPQNVVISGPAGSVGAVTAALEERGIKTRSLNVSHAFHSPLMDPVLEPFYEVAAGVAYASPKLRLISNITGRVAQGSELVTPEYWRDHIRRPVRFTDSILTLQEMGCNVFIEIGPKPTLIGMARQILPAGDLLWLPSLSPRLGDWEQILESLGQLYVRGGKVDWEAFDRPYHRRRVPDLPTYPFQRQSYWFDASATAGGAAWAGLGGGSAHPLLGSRQISASKEILYTTQVGARAPSYLSDRLVHGRCLLPEGACVEIALAAAADVLQTGLPALEELVVHKRLALEEEGLRDLQVAVRPEGPGRASIKIYAQETAAHHNQPEWELLAEARLLGGNPGPANAPLDLEALQAGAQRIDPAAWLEQRKASGLELKPRFQLFDDMWEKQGRVLARVKAPPGTPAGTPAGFLPPALLEASAQLLAAGQPEVVFLPSYVEGVNLHASGTAPAWCMADVQAADGESISGSLSFYDEGGRLVAEVTGLHLSAVTPDDVQADGQDLSSWLYHLAWEAKPLEAQATPDHTPATWIVFAEASGLGSALAQRLRSGGDRCLVVYPDTHEPSIPDQDSRTLDPFDRVAYTRLLEEAAGPGDPSLRGVIHLWGLSAPQGPAFTAGELQAAQRLILGSALYLTQALEEFAANKKAGQRAEAPALWLVTRGAQSLNSEDQLAVAQAPLWGFGKTVTLEQPRLWGGLIDLDPAGGADEAQALAAELRDPDGEGQVAYRRGERFAARLSPRQEPLAPQPPLSFRPEGAYLISGGLGGLGLQVARWMAEEGARRIILLGRSPLPPRKDWDQVPPSSPAAAQIVAIRRIEALGASVFPAAVDVSDEAQLEAFLVRYQEGMGAPIYGIVHAAGVIRDQSLLNLDLDKLQAVLSPKVAGGWLLHQKFRQAPLDFFVCFSSSASLGGSAGQANYTAANAFLDALAHYRRAQGLPALTINWGPWAEAGMAARRDLEARRQRMGMGAIQTRQGLKLLGSLLFQDIAQIGVIPANPRQLCALFPEKSPFLSHLQADEQQAEEAPDDALPVSEQILQTAPEGRAELTLRHLKQRIARVLRMDPERIATDLSLMELGFDSIMIMELIRGLDQDLNLSLYPREIFEQPSVLALAQYLTAEVERLHLPEGMAVARTDARANASVADPVSLSSPAVVSSTATAFEAPARRLPGIAFLLSTPRAGSTLLRVMLAGHPGIFSPPELHLLPFAGMQDRKETLAGSYLDEGLQRALMELKGLDFEGSKALIEEWEAADLPVQEVYATLQELATPRILVDKSPSYGLDLQVLERAEALFENARYIHLVRHPYAVIDSFVRNRMEKIFPGQGMDPAQLAEHVWATVTGNTLDFLESVDPERHMLVRYEDLVRDPEPVARQICDFLGVPFDPALLNPYEGQRMTDGVRSESRSIGDPNFLKRRAIQPELAEAWRKAEIPHRLGVVARRLARELGYETPWPLRPAATQDGAKTKGLPPVEAGPRQEEDLRLSYAQQRLLFIEQFDPGEPTYNIPIAMRLRGRLDISALERSLNDILLRHEALRTRFILHDGEWRQDILPDPRLELRIPSLDLPDDPAEREALVRQQVLDEISRPFDLSQDLMLRAALFPLAPEEHVLSITMHHIASDGWSVGVLVNELSALYRAHLAGEPSPLPALPVQYVDYARWQRQWLEGEALQPHLDYWKEQLLPFPPVLELPTDRPRPAVQTHRGDRLPFQLSPQLTKALKALSQREGVTLFMTLLAAFDLLLFRYSGQTDLAVGVPISGRNRAEITPLIGFFVNTLVMRARLDGSDSFRALLSQVKRTALQAYEHQDVPFERLVEELQPERSLSHSPLFQVMFVLQNAPLPPVELPGLSVTPLEEIHTHTSKFDLWLQLTDHPEGMNGSLEYNTDLFDRETAARMASHYCTLLESLAVDPERAIAQVPILPAGERQQLLVEWNRTELDYPRQQCIHHLFEAQVERSPHKIAVEEGERTFTYTQLNARANRLAAELQQHGVGPESLVGIFTDRSIEMVVGLLGVLKAGGAYLPLDPAFPRERLAFMLDDSQTGIVLTQQSLIGDELLARDLRVICLDESGPEPPDSLANQDSSISPENLAYLLYTSGSTGKPKGVEITHRSVVNFLTSMGREPGLSAEDTLLSVTSLSFDISVLEIFLPLIKGARLLLAGQASAANTDRLIQLLKRPDVTVMQATPTTWSMLVELGWQGKDNLRILCGGEALPRDLANQLVTRCAQLWNMYGPTETTVWSSALRIEAGEGPVPVGPPIANTSFYVLDEHRQLVPTGVPGELHIGGDGLARGYRNRPELTEQRFITLAVDGTPPQRLYKTGDLVRSRPDGTLEFLGRMDHQVKLRGYRIELGEIESLLVQHPAIRDAVVIVREDTPGDKQLVAYPILHQGAAQPSSLDLQNFLRQQLPAYMIPTAFVFLDAYPLTPNKKIDRKRLPAPERAPAEGQEGGVGPRTPTEVKLAAIWREVLPGKNGDIHTSFFNLGGHSLLAVQVISRIEEVFQVRLPLRSIFDAPTIYELAQRIDEHQSGQEPPDQTTLEDKLRMLLG